MSIRQYVISDPPIINYSQRIEDTKGIPTVVWQQQMEKTCIRTYKIVHNDRPDRFYEIDHTKDFESRFRPLPLIEDYHPQYPDPEYGKYPYWDDELYGRQNLKFRRDDYPSTDDEDDPQIEDTKLSRALIELWQPNSEALIEEIEEPQHQEDYQGLNSLLDETAFLHILVEQQGEQPFCAAIFTLDEGTTRIHVNNFTDQPHKLKKGMHIANFSVMTPEQMKHVRPIDPVSTWHLLNENEEDAVHYINSLLKANRNNNRYEQYWFPTPISFLQRSVPHANTKTNTQRTTNNIGFQRPIRTIFFFQLPPPSSNEASHTPIQKRILRELRNLEEAESLNPQEDEESRQKFLSNFDWKDSMLQQHEIKQIEALLVEFHDIFVRHRFDIGMNEEFTVKLTPKDDSLAYSQSLPTPINLKQDILVELALLHKYGIITTLPFSKYASPIFAQKKPNGKLRLLVDLRKINYLISDDYIINNHPVSTLTDAAQHMAGKKLFCKLDCSQAYHCLQMADRRSIEMLAFHFASRTFAYNIGFQLLRIRGRSVPHANTKTNTQRTTKLGRSRKPQPSRR